MYYIISKLVQSRDDIICNACARQTQTVVQQQSSYLTPMLYLMSVGHSRPRLHDCSYPITHITHLTFGVEHHTSLCKNIQKRHLTLTLILTSNVQCPITSVPDFHLFNPVDFSGSLVSPAVTGVELFKI